MATPKLNLDDVEKFTLMKFRRNVADVIKPHHNDYFLVRWLRARSWNLEAAEKMLREWRIFWGVDDLDNWEPPDVLSKYYPSGSIGCDAEGCPVIYVPFSGLDIIGVLHSANRQDMIKLTVKILEVNLKEASKSGGNKLLVVFDMDGFVLKNYTWRPAAEVVVSLIKMYEANYPEILKACYIINAPRVFSVAFTVVKRFLNEYTIGKINIYKSDPKKWKKVLRENIPINILPEYYGGELVDPDGDPKCPSKIRQGGKIPKSYYKNSYDDNTESKGEFTSVVIKKSDRLSLDFIVAEDGQILKWDFRTEGCDIRFGITCQDENGKTTVAVRSHRVASHQLDESGVITCQAPATYTVLFDNSYSIFRSKKLHYNIEVLDPIKRLDTSALDLPQSE